VLIKPQPAASKQEAKARIESKQCRLFIFTMSKNPTGRLKLRHRNKTRTAIFPAFSRETTQFLVVKSLFRIISSSGIDGRTPKENTFSFWFWHC
jgi:hypothetical protein